MGKRIFKFFVMATCLIMTVATYAQSYTPIRTGKHSLTLQWISWEQKGTIEVSAPGQDGYRTVKGEQYGKDKNEFLRVAGKIKQTAKTDLLFEGTIDIQIPYVNNGKLCRREGTYYFKATGTRKYWRLQEMDNCEGNMVTDYVDIYF